MNLRRTLTVAGIALGLTGLGERLAGFYSDLKRELREGPQAAPPGRLLEALDEGRAHPPLDEYGYTLPGNPATDQR